MGVNEELNRILEGKDVIIDADADELIKLAVSRKEGVIAGLSSGASLWAAQQIAAEMDSGNIVVLFGDRGERYFSTRLFDFE